MSKCNKKRIEVKLESVDPTGIAEKSKSFGMKVIDDKECMKVERLILYVGDCVYQIDNNGYIVQRIVPHERQVTLVPNPPTPPEDRKIKGVIHWVSCEQAYPVTIYQYDRLFNDANPAREEDFLQFLNDDSLSTQQAFCEPSLAKQAEGEVFQFERLGYYCVNQVKDSKVQAFHRVVDLKDTWGKIS